MASNRATFPVASFTYHAAAMLCFNAPSLHAEACSVEEYAVGKQRLEPPQHSKQGLLILQSLALEQRHPLIKVL